MICIALANISFEECLNAVNTFDFAEIRLDLLELSEEEVSTIFSSNDNLIATCRPGKYTEEERKKLLLLALQSGAAYVDLEVETGDTFKEEITHAAKEKGCQMIISYHDFEKTPERAELDHVVRWCSECHPDIVKIACMVNSERDNARLLGLLDSDQRMLIVGMGAKGTVSRIVSPLLGSLCTFAAYSSDKATAPGQLSKDALEAIISKIEQL